MYTKGTTVLDGLFTKGDRGPVGWGFVGAGGRGRVGWGFGGLRGRLGSGSEGQVEGGEGGGGHCYVYFLRNLFVLVI